MIRVCFRTTAWPSLAFMGNSFLKQLKVNFRAVTVTDRPDIIFYENQEVKPSDDAKLKIFITGENTSPQNPDAFDLILGFKSVRPNEYYLPLWTFYMNWNADDFKNSHCVANFIKDRKRPLKIPKQFCGFVSYHYRPYRVEFVKKLSTNYKQVTCGGVILNNIGGKIGSEGRHKQEFLRECKFGIAFENENVDTDMTGYTTEKIFEVFAAGIVPIYWGDPTVETVFNPKAFLNRNNFSSDDEFIEEIAAVDQDDERYLKMLEEPIFKNNCIPSSFYPGAVCEKIAELYHTKDFSNRKKQ